MRIEPPVRSRPRRSFADLIPTLTAMAVVLVARSSFADHYVVPSGSMLPTVELQDHVVVNKVAYGLRPPLASRYLVHFAGPERGDVVVLDAPDTGTVLLKRVVGLPGDEIEVRGERVYVNGKPAPLETFGGQALETLGKNRHVLDLGDGGGPDYGPNRLPDGGYLVLGDHRGNSRDGRYFGLVQRDAILGKVEGILVRGGSFTWKPL